MCCCLVRAHQGPLSPAISDFREPAFVTKHMCSTILVPLEYNDCAANFPRDDAALVQSHFISSSTALTQSPTAHKNAVPLAPATMTTADSSFLDAKLKMPRKSIQLTHKLKSPIQTTAVTVSPCRRRFACNWLGCEYKALRRSHLTQHQLSHTGERPFKCTWYVYSA